MKRVVIITLSFLCAIVCSCKKEPQKLLEGVWEVSVEVTYKADIGETTTEKTFDGGVWYYTFYKEGNGKRVKTDDVDDSYQFTYLYHEEDNTIDFITNGISSAWVVDVLTNNSFFCHSSNASSSTILGLPVSGSIQTTYSGKKVK